MIPKSIREVLGLEPGDTLEVERTGGVIHLHARNLEKLQDDLRGRYAGESLVEELEQERHKERKRDQKRYS